MMTRPKILFIDAYDSFSNNVVSLLMTVLGAEVDVVAIDSDELSVPHDLRRYDAVVCGPGPGSADREDDVGLMRSIWALGDEHLVPVLGICLGFQSLAVSCGAKVRMLEKTGLHGMIRRIEHHGGEGEGEGNIFSGVPPFRATLYHSLCVDVGQAAIPDADWAEWKWQGHPDLPDIVPLAWVEEARPGFSERILMGMRHRTKPFWALQYHPESVCSEAAGHAVISNWFRQASDWSRANGRLTEGGERGPVATARRPPLLLASTADGTRDRGRLPSMVASGARYRCVSIPLPAHVEVADIVELVQSGKRNHIILDSSSAHAQRIGLEVRGRYSIIAMDVEDALRFEYQSGAGYVTVHQPCLSAEDGDMSRQMGLGADYNIWQLLAEFLEQNKIASFEGESPFIGGLMGYVTYEMGLECIDVEISKDRGHSRPDLCFAWITRSLVLDHVEGTVRIQHLCPEEAVVGRRPEGLWPETIRDLMLNSTLWSHGLRLDLSKARGGRQDLTPPITPTNGGLSPAHIQVPDAAEYESKVRRCQAYIAAGHSYELCLTEQTHISQPQRQRQTGSSSSPSSSSSSPSWQLYRALRTRQPAPFGSYVRLGGATLISSSPERFLEYGRDGACSMRPMKGTVRKSAAVSTLAEAERILRVPKEEAENLMIVDLVRHDLHAVCGPGNVQVPQLLRVEEYASVFQMVSVVRGQLPNAAAGAGAVDAVAPYSGLDMLAASLPPGSMTGAPKKRSCEILREVEAGAERSLYAGLVGYMDASGRGDWSVTIRSLFRWDDEARLVRRRRRRRRGGDGGEDGVEDGEVDEVDEVWHIGAGGAVTALSTPEAERDEMFTKLRGPLGLFQEQA